MLVSRPPEGSGEKNEKGDVAVTDFDAGSVRRGLGIITVVVAAVALAGCETASSLFGSNDPAPAPVAQSAPEPAARAVPVLSMTPIIGAPDQVGKQLIGQIESAAGQHRFAVISDKDAKGDYTVRGYMVAARDRAGTKVSYIWDIADSSGKRVHRVTGEEVVAAPPNARDPWSAVGPSVVQTIAGKTAAQLGSWLPSQPLAGPAVASAAPVPASGAGAAGVDPSAGAPGQGAARPAVSNTTTAAVPRDDVVAVVPVITGAPGDGNAALTEALQRELSRQGLSLVDRPGASYRVEGKVAVGAAKDGKQPVQIDWRVRDPQGKSLGTVSQKNEIPPGQLDGQWGKTADAAAAAAAQGIVKLLPQARQTN